jgi:imidazolonepropionase-like amidohydrolase
MHKFAALGLCALLGAGVSAQDLTITNARIIVGDGTVIEQGSIVARGGRIASVNSGAPTNSAGRTVDAAGMTAMPGFIDAHRHIIRGDADDWLETQAAERMQEFLEAGFTTLLAGGGPAEGNLELKQRIDADVLKGPRVIPAERVDLNQSTPEEARSELRRLAQLGIQFIGEESLDPEPSPKQLENLKALVDEGRRAGVWVMVHAVSPQAMLAAVDAGAPKLVHTPHFGWLTDEDARRVAAADIENLSTIGFGVPVFGVFAEDNEPRFRDGRPWPDAIIAGEGRGREAGYKAVNARTLWDNGVVYGFGTDTNYLPQAGLEHELKSLNLMFSMQDIVELMGPNTAAFIERSNELGTLAPGKLADIVLLDRNPLDGYWNMLKPEVVIKGGRIVIDRR